MECQNTLPRNHFDFFEWLTKFNEKKDDFSPLQQAQFVSEAIVTSKLDFQFMRGLQDKQPEDGNAPLLNLPEESKEIIRLQTFQSLPSNKQLLLLVRNYISKDSLRIINLEQRIIELWRQHSQHRLALQQIYFWFSDIIFLNNSIVLQIIKWPHLPQHDLIVWSKAPQDLLLQIPFNMKNISQRQGFVRMTLKCTSPAIVQNAINRYLSQLFQYDTKQAIKLIKKLQQISYGYSIPISDQQILGAACQSSTYDQIVDIFVERLERGQDVYSDMWLHAPQNLTNQRQPVLLLLILSVTHTSMTQNQHMALISELIRRLFSNRKTILFNTKLLLFLMSHTKFPLVDQIVKHMISCIRFCQCSQAYLGCMSVIQACILDGASCNILDILNSRQYSTALNQAESEAYRRLFVLAACKIIKKNNDGQLLMLINRELATLKNMNPVVREQRKVESIIKLENSRYLYKIDQFSQVRQVYSELGVEYVFRGNYRHFNQHSSCIRQQLTIKR